MKDWKMLEQVKDAETPEEMRAELYRLQHYDPLVRAVMDSANYRGASAGDRYTVLAYNALKQLAEIKRHVLSDYKRVPTSAEVWAVIRARHPEMRAFGSYSAPDGDQFGDPSKGKMFTSYGFEHGDFPVMEAQTTWDIDPEAMHNRKNERHEYWLCLPVREDA